MSVILCTAGYDATIRFWEALSGICSRTIPIGALVTKVNNMTNNVNRLCISPDKRYLAAAVGQNVILYDIVSTNPAPVLAFEGHSKAVTGVAFHCEGKWMVTSSEDHLVKVWDTKTGKEQRKYDHRFPVNDVVIHPNQGELIAGDQGGNVRVWDLAENKCSHQMVPEENKSVASVTVASDGSLLCASVSTIKVGQIFVWRLVTVGDITTMVPVTKFTAHKAYITRILLSPDVRHLATCSADHTARIWAVDPAHPGSGASEFNSNTNDGPEKTNGNGNGAVVTSNGNASVNGQNGSTSPQKSQVVDQGFELEQELDGHQRWVWDCAFSADSAYLVTVCTDHFARLWELASKTVIRQYNGHHKGCVCVALNDYSEG